MWKRMEQSEKIAKMDKHMEEIRSAICSMSEAILKCEKSLKPMKELTAYYGTEEWLDDVEDYQSSKLPENLKCNVLLDNAVFYMCMEYRDLAIRMLEFGTIIVKKYGM